MDGHDDRNTKAVMEVRVVLSKPRGIRDDTIHLYYTKRPLSSAIALAGSIVFLPKSVCRRSTWARRRQHRGGPLYAYIVAGFIGRANFVPGLVTSVDAERDVVVVGALRRGVIIRGLYAHSSLRTLFAEPLLLTDLHRTTGRTLPRSDQAGTVLASPPTS